MLDPLDVNITWLLQRLDAASLAPVFAISRAASSCLTPRRNSDIEAAFSHFHSFSSWARSVHSYFSGVLFPLINLPGTDAQFALSDDEAQQLKGVKNFQGIDLVPGRWVDGKIVA